MLLPLITFHFPTFSVKCSRPMVYTTIIISISSLTLAVQLNSIQLLSHVWLFVTSWTAAHQASLSITNSWSLPKLMSIESVMPSNHLILCAPFLPPPIFPSIRHFSNKSFLHIRWPKYWSFSFSIRPSNEYSGLMSLRRQICSTEMQEGRKCCIRSANRVGGVRGDLPAPRQLGNSHKRGHLGS